jgi:hypothetical protein
MTVHNDINIQHQIQTQDITYQTTTQYLQYSAASFKLSGHP